MRCGDTDYPPRVRVTQLGCRRPRKAEERRRVPRRRDEGGVRCLDARTAAPPIHRACMMADGRAASRDASGRRGMYRGDERRLHQDDERCDERCVATDAPHAPQLLLTPASSKPAYDAAGG